MTIILNEHNLPDIEKSNQMFVQSLFGLNREHTLAFINVVKQAYYEQKDIILKSVDIYNHYKDYKPFVDVLVVAQQFILIHGKDYKYYIHSF